MDPKGDRLRKLKMGMLKLPESVLKSNNIILTPEPAKIGGCLEGGARPRPQATLEGSVATSQDPIIIPTTTLPVGRLPPDVDIPLPNDADIPLPLDCDIPLPSSLKAEEIPLPRDEDIPLPSDASIPLPADKPASQQERRKTKSSLGALEPRADELLCRSCEMRFVRQLEYDLHLQSEAHQQAIKDLQDDKFGASLLLPRQDRKSPRIVADTLIYDTPQANKVDRDETAPTGAVSSGSTLFANTSNPVTMSNDGKSSTVSFTFKKNLGARITNTQPFLRRDDKSDRNIGGEIKMLRLEPEDTIADKMSSLANSVGPEREDLGETELIDHKDILPPSKETKFLCSFVKVQSKDDSGRMLNWPKEMIQYTHTEPKLMFSCNPLVFDFSQLLLSKGSKKSPAHAEPGTLPESKEEEDKVEGIDESIEKGEEEKKAADGEKKKSHKKKKKKKHRKHKEKTEEKEGEEKAEENNVEEGTVSKKKKKKKHKKKSEDREKEEVNETGDNAGEKEKKKHKKSKKKKHQSEEDKGKENETGEEDKKSKKRKHSKRSKKKKKKHQQSESEAEMGDKDDNKKEDTKEKSDSVDSDTDKDKVAKKKHKKKKKHSKKEGNNESSESEAEKSEKKPTPAAEVHPPSVVEKRKIPNVDSDAENDKIVAKLQALSRTKITAPPVMNNTLMHKKAKKEPETHEKRTPSDRKRVNSESSVSEQTPTPSKKLKAAINKTPTGPPKDKTPVAHATLHAEMKAESKEESWSKIETQTNDNVKSKWDTSESDIENALDEKVKKKPKVLKKRKPLPGPMNKPNAAKELKSPPLKVAVKAEPEQKKVVNPSSQRSNKSNVSAASAKKVAAPADKHAAKPRRASPSPASSHSSRSRSRSYRSYSRSSSRSHSRSYSSSSYYSDRSRSRRTKRRKHRRHRSSSYSSSSSRSRSRSYHRHRSRSSSYSDYSRSRSYSSSRSRSRSRRKRRRSYSRRRSRSYSTTSYSSRSRSRSRSRRRVRRKNRRKTKSRDRTMARTSIDFAAKKLKEEKAKPAESKKVDPCDIPLPDLSGKKDDELSEEKLQKLKEKKPRTDVGKTVAKLVESLPADIPLPFSEGATNTVSSDSLPSGPPVEKKETDTGFIGPRLPPPPPPPIGHNMGPPRYPPNHGPPGPPRPGYGPGQWDHWEGHGHWDDGHGSHWDNQGHWDAHGHGPGPGPRPPFRGMRPPFDPRMRGPYDPRMRGPPQYMNRPRGPYMGPRYPGPGGPHQGHPPEYDSHYTEDEPRPRSAEPPKKESPPPLPPPKVPSPKPPPPTKKEKEKDKEPEQNPDIVIPPEQAEQYKQLQKQAAKHARRQLRRQQKKELGEPDEDTSSSEEEPEDKQTVIVQAGDEETLLIEEMPQQMMVQQVPLVLAQPQPTSSPHGYVVAVSNGQQILLQKQPTIHYSIASGMPMQAGQPVIAVSQGGILASAAAAAAGAQPAHIMPNALAAAQAQAQAQAQAHAGTHYVTASHSGIPIAVHSAASLQQLQQAHQFQQLQQLQHMQQVHQAQQIQQIQQAQAIQAHNQAVAAHHAAQAAQAGPIIVGNQVLVPRIGIRPAI